MMPIACVGTGTVGRSWAIAFARSGREVRLWDPNPPSVDRAMEQIADALRAPADKSLGDEAGAQILGRLRVCSTLDEAIAGCEHIQESAPERLELKRALFATLDEATPIGVVLASSTSALRGSLFAEHLVGRGRVIVAHPVNPPHLVPLVEVCPTPWTDRATTDRTHALMTEIGQTPIHVAQEVTGFVLNRLQWALLGEALHLVDAAICSPADIDKVLTDGLALRWAFAGPFEVGHLNDVAGFRGYFANLGSSIDQVRQDLCVRHPATPELIDRVHAALCARIPEGEIPNRQVWRDEEILALRRHLNKRAFRETNRK